MKTCRGTDEQYLPGLAGPARKACGKINASRNKDERLTRSMHPAIPASVPHQPAGRRQDLLNLFVAGLDQLGESAAVA